MVVSPAGRLFYLNKPTVRMIDSFLVTQDPKHVARALATSWLYPIQILSDNVGIIVSQVSLM